MKNSDYLNTGYLQQALHRLHHRVASRGRVPGISKICMDFCKSQISNLRGDTYKDNIVMQKVFAKNGFEKCGTIYLAGKKEDGNARIAYQFVGK